MCDKNLFDDIVDTWNAAADEYNQWSELDEQEKVQYAFMLGKQHKEATEPK